MKKRRAIIVDLDNTLWDSSLLLLKYWPKNELCRSEWDEFHKHTDQVIINVQVLDLINPFIEQGIDVLFVTGREDKPVSRLITERLLQTVAFYVNSDSYFHLYMRNEDDYRFDPDVKKDIYLKKIEPYFDVILAFDDRQDICEMWQEFNIPTVLYTQKKGL